jgi:BTK motif
MWWCCGKTARDAPGCKFAKHESKEDEDDDVEQLENGNLE